MRKEDTTEDTIEDSSEVFEVVKYELSENEFTQCGGVAESDEEIFQLCLSGDNRDLIATIVEGFIIWPLAAGGLQGLARLSLPTEFRNVISRPSGSNSCVLNKSKDVAIAGVREFIFVWNIATEQLIKHFQGHYGRIIRFNFDFVSSIMKKHYRMSSLIEGKWNHAVTSSMDRTIKVSSLDATNIDDCVARCGT